MGVLLTPTQIISHLYCPRFTFFLNCLNIEEHQEKRFKVMKGRLIHDDKTRINKDYFRKRIGVTAKEIEVYLSSEKYHLRGVVDEVLTLKDGTMAPLDYKFAEYQNRHFKTLKTQSLAYGLLISDNYGRTVSRGYIVYTRSRNRLECIEFSNEDYEGFKQTVDEMIRIILKGYYPKKTRTRSKCPDCTYRNICV